MEEFLGAAILVAPVAEKMTGTLGKPVKDESVAGFVSGSGPIRLRGDDLNGMTASGESGGLSGGDPPGASDDIRVKPKADDQEAHGLRTTASKRRSKLS